MTTINDMITPKRFKERFGFLPEHKLKELAKSYSKKCGYNLYEACFPLHPLKIKRENKVSDEEIELLKQWVSVSNSVEASVWDSIWYSIRDSIWYSVRDSVWDSVRYSVSNSLWASVRDSVSDSIWASVWASVWDSLWAYISTLFPNIENWKKIDHEPGINPFQSNVELWKRGLVQSYDGNIWRLHSGQDAKVIWEGKI